MHFKISVVFAFILYIYIDLDLCQTTTLYRFFTINGDKATFMVYLKNYKYILYT